MKKTGLPTIVKIIQNKLEERAPPDESEYEFVETWPDNTTHAPNKNKNTDNTKQEKDETR